MQPQSIVPAADWRGRGEPWRPIDVRVRDAIRSLVRSQPPEVTLRAAFDEGEIRLDLVKVEPESRGRGLGTRTLQALLTLADSLGVPVCLHALSLPGEGGGLDQQALERWYAGHGFADTGERSVMGLTLMRRLPRLEKPGRSPPPAAVRRPEVVQVAGECA